MKSIILILFVFFLTFYGCQEKKNTGSSISSENIMQYAEGIAIYKHEGYSVVKVSNPWPNANSDYTYILREKIATIPDSLLRFPTIVIPINRIITTSTTHIPALEMLSVENSLVGFPGTDYISSEKVRSRIDAGKVRNLGISQNLNTEVVIELQPDVIIAHGIDNNNPTLDNLQKSGLKVIVNGDWNEQSPLGKAEWIKLYGALYGKTSEANKLFISIEKSYNNTLELAKKATSRPTVISGAIFANNWYLPQGKSWASLLIHDAGGNYLWHDTKGTGSLSLPFESVYEKGKNAEFWIGPGQFTSFDEMADANIHYTQFAAFTKKKIFSYSIKKGKTGGIIYYELSQNRPDLLLKDFVKILHPELLPEYQLYFYQKLN